jgi:hypothetical protein
MLSLDTHSFLFALSTSDKEKIFNINDISCQCQKSFSL